MNASKMKVYISSLLNLETNLSKDRETARSIYGGLRFSRASRIDSYNVWRSGHF